jgi:hypothetical protein
MDHGMSKLEKVKGILLTAGTSSKGTEVPLPGIVPRRSRVRPMGTKMKAKRIIEEQIIGS